MAYVVRDLSIRADSIQPMPDATAQSPAQPADIPAPAKRRCRWRRRLLVVSSLLLILLVTTEITLRVRWGIGNPLLYAPDPDCLYVVAPSQHVYNFGALNEVNSFSMRSPQITLHKAPGVTRVLFVGDSVTYGTNHIDQSLLATSLLAQRLPAIVHGPVEVMNASAGGWAPANEVAYLRSRGTFDADLIVE